MKSIFRRTGLWITASIALNVFLAGLLIGTFVKQPPGFPFARSGQPPGAIFSVEAVMMSLRETDRALARRSIAGKAGEMRTAIRELRRAQRSAAGAMEGDPLDDAALQSALAEIRERSQVVQAVVHEMIADLAGTLDPADRARLARAVFQSSLYGIPLAGHPPAHRTRERRG